MKICDDHPDSLPETILQVLEKSWGVKLPESYRLFLLKHNGGKPDPGDFLLKDQSNGSTVDGFLGVYPDPYNDLIQCMNFSKEQIPERFFPIAKDNGGNLICISLKNPDRGKIYFWDHDRWDGEGRESNDANIGLIADSFEEFLNGLYKVPLPE